MNPLADYRTPVQSYNPIMNMVINETTRVICYNQTIYDDNRMEDDELFSLTLTVQEYSASSTQVDPLHSSTIVKIVDDDGQELQIIFDLQFNSRPHYITCLDQQ